MTGVAFIGVLTVVMEHIDLIQVFGIFKDKSEHKKKPPILQNDKIRAGKNKLFISKNKNDITVFLITSLNMSIFQILEKGE